MHLVRLAFQPVEKTPDPVPFAFSPELFPGHPGTFPFQNPALVRFRQFFKRRPHRNPPFPSAPDQVALAFLTVFSLKGLNDPGFETQPAVRHCPVEIDLDGASESTALRARAGRVVEAEQSRRGRHQVDAAPCAVPACGECPHPLTRTDPHPALAHPQCRFDRLHQAPTVLLTHLHPVLKHLQLAAQIPRQFLGPHCFAADPDPEIPLPDQKPAELHRIRPSRDWNHKAQKRGLALRHTHPALQKRGHNPARRFGPDHTPAFWTPPLRHPGQEQFEVVGDLRDGPHRGPAGFDRVSLLNCNGRWYPQNLVHLRFVHPLQKLPGVRRKCFHVPPLALGVHRVKREARFPAPARSGDHDPFPQRQPEIEPAQVVLARTADFDAAPRVHCLSLFFHVAANLYPGPGNCNPSAAGNAPLLSEESRAHFPGGCLPKTLPNSLASRVRSEAGIPCFEVSSMNVPI